MLHIYPRVKTHGANGFLRSTFPAVYSRRAKWNSNVGCVADAPIFCSLWCVADAPYGSFSRLPTRILRITSRLFRASAFFGSSSRIRSKSAIAKSNSPSL